MVSKYWLLMKSEDGRLIRHDTWGVINGSGQEEADCEAMVMLGERLLREAAAIRRYRAEKAA
jgi:hypothetical protein